MYVVSRSGLESSLCCSETPELESDADDDRYTRHGRPLQGSEPILFLVSHVIILLCKGTFHDWYKSFIAKKERSAKAVLHQCLLHACIIVPSYCLNYYVFYLIVPLNKMGSCGMIAMRCLRVLRGTWLMSTSSMRIRPEMKKTSRIMYLQPLLIYNLTHSIPHQPRQSQ